MGLTNDLVEVGIGVGLIVVAANLLGNGNITLPSLSGLPSLPNNSNTPNPFASAGSGGNAPTDILNGQIDVWFDKANGFFGTGIAGYDPTDWGAFTKYGWMYVQWTLPSSPTPYFMSKVNQFTGYSKPGGQGY